MRTSEEDVLRRRRSECASWSVEPGGFSRCLRGDCCQCVHFIASSSDAALPVRRHWLVGQDRARGDEPSTGRLEVQPAPPSDRHMVSGDPGLERILASGDDGVATGEFGRIESMIAPPPAGKGGGGARFGVLIPALKRACPSQTAPTTLAPPRSAR